MRKAIDWPGTIGYVVFFLFPLYVALYVGIATARFAMVIISAAIIGLLRHMTGSWLFLRK